MSNGGGAVTFLAVQVPTMTLLFALLAIAANIATIVIVVMAVGGRFSSSLRTQRDSLFDSMAGYELWFAFTVALVATLGSLYLSEIAHFEPCRLCWYQRIAMYPLPLILGIAAVRRDGGVWVYAAPIAAIGALIAGYHYLIQRMPQLDSGSCSTGVPCTAAYVERFGFITIPYMAASAFLLVLAMLWVVRANNDMNAPSSTDLSAANA